MKKHLIYACVHIYNNNGGETTGQKRPFAQSERRGHRIDFVFDKTFSALVRDRFWVNLVCRTKNKEESVEKLLQNGLVVSRHLLFLYPQGIVKKNRPLFMK